MIQAQYQQLVLHWHILKTVLAKGRDEEDGMASLEIVIIASVLLVIAGLLAAAFNTIWSNHKSSIS